MYSEDIKNTMTYLRQPSLTADVERPYRSPHWINSKQNYCVTKKKLFFDSTSISRQLATEKESRSVILCTNYFSAEICEKDVLSPIGWPDTEVVSLLPQPNSTHSPLSSIICRMQDMFHAYQCSRVRMSIVRVISMAQWYASSYRHTSLPVPND